MTKLIYLIAALLFVWVCTAFGNWSWLWAYLILCCGATALFLLVCGFNERDDE